MSGGFSGERVEGADVCLAKSLMSTGSCGVGGRAAWCFELVSGG